MKYTKPPLPFNKQAQLLISRGLEADEQELERFLSKVNYYRFSGYLFPFRSVDKDNFLPGTRFDYVRNIYYFDSDLRLFTLSAIEVIEIAILRTRMVEKFTLKCGAFCYVNQQNFNADLPIEKHEELMRRIKNNIDQSTEEFVSLYKTKYSKEEYFPFWMVAEVSTFGILSTIFQYLPNNVKVPLAKQYNLHSDVLESWLRSLSTIRNICAHHSRLWNRILPNRPEIPIMKHHPEFHKPTQIGDDSYFVILAILKYLLGFISPERNLLGNFCNILEKFPNITINKMGFPSNWLDYKIFKN